MAWHVVKHRGAYHTYHEDDIPIMIAKHDTVEAANWHAVELQLFETVTRRTTLLIDDLHQNFGFSGRWPRSYIAHLVVAHALDEQAISAGNEDYQQQAKEENKCTT